MTKTGKQKKGRIFFSASFAISLTFKLMLWGEITDFFFFLFAGDFIASGKRFEEYHKEKETEERIPDIHNFPGLWIEARFCS